jgi:DNA-binding LacI/PurR family transcriptional regulator
MKRQRRVTIKDIARYLGISSSTVSRALSGGLEDRISLATQKKVLKAASALEYYPNLMARAIVKRKSGVLGLLTCEIFYPGQSSYVQDIVMEAHRHGYQVTLGVATSSRSEDVLDDLQVQVRQMISMNVDGLLIHMRGIAGEERQIVDSVGDVVPAVAFSHPIEGISNVVLDRVAGAYAAAEHLIRLGHQRIGFVGVDWARARMSARQGYLRAVQEYGLTPEEVFVDGETLEEGYRLGVQMGRASDRATALIYCSGVLLGIGICRGLQEVGVRVPEEVAVVGGDTSGLGAYCTPPMTAVTPSVEEVCRYAIRLLIDQLNGEPEVRRVTIQPRLIVRKSCGADLRLQSAVSV